MTIVTSVKVRDGLVLGTDSMTQIVGSAPGVPAVFLKAYSNARKLFQVGKQAGVMTFGMGNLGDHSIEGLVRDFRLENGEQMAIEDLAIKLFAFIEPKWREVTGPAPNPDQHQLGFLVAGYSPEAAFAETFEFVLPRDDAPQGVQGHDDFGLLWRGIEMPLIRLVKGIDPRVLDALIGAGAPPEPLLSAVRPAEWFLSQPGMPIQDAANLVEFLLNTTIGVSTFVDANPTCGGPLQVAAILPDRGFGWLTEPRLALQMNGEPR